MELREPKRKRVPSHIKIHQPFPILIESESGIQSHSSLWTLYTGIFNGDCVIVYNREEMESLYNMGFFGKGTFSRGYPTFELPEVGKPPFIYSRQWIRRKKWMEDIKQGLKNNPFHSEPNKLSEGNKSSNVSNLAPGTNESDSSNLAVPSNEKSENVAEIMEVDRQDSEKTKDLMQSEISNTSETILDDDSQNSESLYNSNIVVINDYSDDDENILINPKVSIESESVKSVQETLNLNLEEAFFLSYALGCLNVFDWTGQLLTLTKMWCTFRQTQSDFIENYVAYHYFRAKGWIVKPGYRFGGDLMLYKQGPPFYHASYIVIVETIKENKETSENFSWNKLLGINRIAEAAGKEVLLCQVFWPSQLDSKDLDSPQVLPRFEVNEILLRRWVSSQEREDKN